MRRAVSVLLILLCLVLVAASALYLLRIPIAERLLADRLADAGYPRAGFHLTELGWSHARVEDLVLDPDHGPRARDVAATYSPFRLLAGETRHATVTVDGLEAHLRLGAGGGATAEGGATPSGAGPVARALAVLPALPNLRVQAARIRVDAPYGPWFVDLDASLHQPEAGPPIGELDGRVRNERLRVDGKIGGHLEGHALDASLVARENDGFSLKISGRAEDLARQPRVSLELASDLPAQSDLPWALLPGPQPRAGSIRVNGKAAGRLDALVPPTSLADALQRLAAGDWAGTYRVEARGVDVYKRFSALDLDAAGTFSVEPNAVVVSSGGTGTLALGSVDEALWGRLSPPAPIAPYLAGPVRATWASGEVARLQPAPRVPAVSLQLSPRLDIRWPNRSAQVSLAGTARALLGGEAGVADWSVHDLDLAVRDLPLPVGRVARAELTGEVETTEGSPSGDLSLALDVPALHLGRVRVEDFQARIPAAVSDPGGGMRLALKPGGALSAGAASIGGTLQSRTGVSASIDRGRLDFTPGRPYSVGLTLRSGDFGLRGGSPDLHVRVLGGRITTRGDLAAAAPDRIEIRDASFAVPERQVRIEGLAATVHPAAGTDFADFSMARAYQDTQPSYLAPVTMHGHVARSARGLEITGKGSVADGRAPFGLSGHASGDGAQGTLQVTVPTLNFRGGGLQPGDLVPALGMIRDATGSTQADAALRWGARGVDGTARLDVDALSFRTPRFRVSDLGGRLQLSHLVPVRSEPGQEFRAGTIDAGVPVTDARVRFAVVADPGGGTALRIAEARGSVFGGLLRVRDWSFDPGSQVHNFAVRVDDVDLRQMLDKLSIQGLRGRGRLSGGLPVTIANGRIGIRSGELRGTDGHVEFQSRAADQSLGGSSGSVDTMLRALRNFNYDSMEVDVDRALEGDTALGIHMRGRNPEVMDGQLFNFNIAVTGDVDPLIDALAAGRKLTDELIQRSLKLRRSRTDDP